MTTELMIIPSAEAPEPAHAAYADQLLEQLAAVDVELKATKDAARLAVQRVVERWEDVARPLADRRSQLVAEIETVSRRLAFVGKKKSRTLGAGEVGWRTKAAHLFVEDEAAALTWVKTVPPVGPEPLLEEVVRVKTTESIDQAKLQAYALAKQIVPAGCRLDPATEVFHVTPRLDVVRRYEPPPALVASLVEAIAARAAAGDDEPTREP